VMEQEIGHRSRGIAGYWVGRTLDEGKMAHENRLHGNVTVVSQACGILGPGRRLLGTLVCLESRSTTIFS
jgi:hypothetical protein